MKLSIIGGGRVGRVLGVLARRAGYAIGEVVCRSRPPAADAVRFIGSGHASDIITSAVFDSDVVIISVVDAAISPTARLLARVYRSEPGGEGVASNKKKVVLHTSGALSSDQLAPLHKKKLAVGSCHPLQTFEDPARAINRIANTYFSVEGDKEAVRCARRFVKDVGGKSFVVPSEIKGLYHASAVLASGGLVALLSVCSEFLTTCGLSEREAITVLLPLIQGTVENIGRVGIKDALTGPVRRGDIGTIAKNIASIDSHHSQWVELYRILASRSVDIVGRGGKSKQSVARLRRAIEKPIRTKD